MPLVLYADAALESPFGMSVFVALTEKRIPFTLRGVDLDRGEQHRPTFAGPSLTARIPAIEHDGFWLSESLAILEYLEEVFPETPLLPDAPRERARARQVMGWLRSDLVALRNERPTSAILGSPRSTVPLSAEARAAADKLLAVASTLLRPGSRILFSRFTIADVDLALALHRLLAHGDPVPAALETWARAVFARPSIRAFVELQRPWRGDRG